MVLRALLHGLYTRIVAVTLWTISLVNDSSWWTTTYFIEEIISGISTVLVDIVIVVMKAIHIFHGFNKSTSDVSRTAHFATYINWFLIYALLTLTTKGRAPESRKFVAILIESLAMYSLSLAIYPTLASKNSESSYYVVAPTLLVGRDTVSAHANAIWAQQKMVTMLEYYAPLVGYFRGNDINNSGGCHRLDDGNQTSSGLLGKEIG
ncbi:hypothetical protein EDD85DRAFT_785200 [Armillaria nabsnona]|nr:hypothetical protein EDD85DRAFT_785200 [Armillaria nabsnona]